MKAINFNEPGKANVLQLVEQDKPFFANDEVLIEVAAAGVNRPDIMQRKGLYPPPADASPLLGLEVAGRICAVGGATTRWQVGDAVCALVNGGGYAEYAAAPGGQCLPIPAGLSMSEAASLPETFFTVWSNVFDRAALRPGETLLVHGGSSGIGTTAIQMAKVWGSEVIVTAGSEEKCAACQQLGAGLAINYRTENFVNAVQQHTDGRGVDVILDMVGGDYIQRNIDIAAEDGRIINIAFLQGFKEQVNFMPIMLKRLTLSGSTLRPRTRRVKASIASALRSDFWPHIEAQKIRPVIAAEFPLAEAAEAHRLMESSEHIGKIVLQVNTLS